MSEQPTTFRKVTAGHYVHDETGVEIVKVPSHRECGYAVGVRWEIRYPSLAFATKPRDSGCHSLANARARAVSDGGRIETVREMIARAWDDAHRENEDRDGVVRPVHHLRRGYQTHVSCGVTDFYYADTHEWASKVTCEACLAADDQRLLDNAHAAALDEDDERRVQAWHQRMVDRDHAEALEIDDRCDYCRAIPGVIHWDGRFGTEIVAETCDSHSDRIAAIRSTDGSLTRQAVLDDLNAEARRVSALVELIKSHYPMTEGREGFLSDPGGYLAYLDLCDEDVAAAAIDAIRNESESDHAEALSEDAARTVDEDHDRARVEDTHRFHRAVEVAGFRRCVRGIRADRARGFNDPVTYRRFREAMHFYAQAVRLHDRQIRAI